MVSTNNTISESEAESEANRLREIRGLQLEHIAKVALLGAAAVAGGIYFYPEYQRINAQGAGHEKCSPHYYYVELETAVMSRGDFPGHYSKTVPCLIDDSNFDFYLYQNPNPKGSGLWIGSDLTDSLKENPYYRLNGEFSDTSREDTKNLSMRLTKHNPDGTSRVLFQQHEKVTGQSELFGDVYEVERLFNGILAAEGYKGSARFIAAWPKS